jgi:hypothetical protein
MSKDLALISAHPAVAAVCAAVALAAVFMAWRAGRHLAAAAGRVLRGRQAEDVLTVVAAGMATAVAMTGMWRFFGAVLHFSGAERAAMFAFLELAVVTCAFRARRNMRAFGSAGAEGIAVWVLSGLSAVFSSLDARSGAEAVFRLAPPLVAAWLWHRAMSLEHRRLSGRSVHWRLTAERVLVWLRLAEPSARAAGDVDAHRRIARLARAAKRLRERRAAGAASWRQDRARRRLDAAMEAAVEHAGLASDPARQDQMRDQLGALNAAGSLASLDTQAPWDRRQAEAAEVARIRQEADALVQAAGQDRDQAAEEAARAAETRIQAAAEETARVRADAGQIADAARARAAALEQAQADLRARAELAEREVEAARGRAAELGDALAHAESRADEVRQEAVPLVHAAEQARDEAVAEARQAAEAAIQAAARDAGRDAGRARADADRITEMVTARIAALEQAQADLRARADLAERELATARGQAAELDEALARAESRAGNPADDGAGEIDRDALVAELAMGILTAARSGDKWRPPYEDLMERTGRKLRWCEYLASDARSAVFGPGGQAPEEPAADSARNPQNAETRADNDRSGELVLAGAP